MKKFLTLAKVELKLSIRSFDAVFFGIIMPLIILIIINFVNREIINENFGAYLAIGICAIGLMALPLVLSDYRSKNILKRFKVTPVSPMLLLSVQLLVQSLMAISSALIVSLTATTLFNYTLKGSILSMILSFLLVLISIFSIGLLIASLSPDMKKAGFVCSLVYFPMLLLSGTTVPSSIFPQEIQRIADFLPLTQGIKLLNGISLGGSLSDYPFQIFILTLIPVISIIIAVKTFRWEMN